MTLIVVIIILLLRAAFFLIIGGIIVTGKIIRLIVEMVAFIASAIIDAINKEGR